MAADELAAQIAELDDLFVGEVLLEFAEHVVADGVVIGGEQLKKAECECFARIGTAAARIDKARDVAGRRQRVRRTGSDRYAPYRHDTAGSVVPGPQVDGSVRIAMAASETVPVARRVVGRFPALANRNYRRYALGQLASIGGTWMQTVALAWHVLQITDSGRAVGLVSAAQFAPALLLGAWSGALADRFEARRAVLVLQIVLGAQALALAVVVFSGSRALWPLVALAMWQGVGTAFDPPIRQGLMNALVGDAELPTAVATNSALVQMGLIVGPAFAAVLLRTVGTGWCFVVNALSYVVMYVAISAIRPSEMHHRPRAIGTDASVRAGFAYIRASSEIALLLAVVAGGSLVAFRLEVLLPILARDLGGKSGLFAALTMMRGVGALLASLWLASRPRALQLIELRNACALLAVALGLLVVPNETVALVALFPAGVGMLAVLVGTLSMSQTVASPEFRGRVVGLWFVVMNGGVVGGSLLVGALAQGWGIHQTFAVGAATMAMLAVALTRRSS
jgi:MFS family permease